ncbi:hypothetical protein, partial [Klebsiella variicola]|uniref:hypothetical protein n=1 Tax=Klebsiella variicola TaxID=244366 RepID=UPI00272F9134
AISRDLLLEHPSKSGVCRLNVISVNQFTLFAKHCQQVVLAIASQDFPLRLIAPLRPGDAGQAGSSPEAMGDVF